MKIAFCSKGNFYLEKGFTKNRIELAESLRRLGWDTVLVDKKMIGIPKQEKYNAIKHSKALKNFLLNNEEIFDVVLYEYDTLPFERQIFNSKTLFIARPAILDFHLDQIKFKYDLKTRVLNFQKKLKKKFFESRANQYDHLDRITMSLSNADVIQVQNRKDKNLLISRGYAGNRIIIVPNGISKERIEQFGRIHHTFSAPFNIAFVGTFDYRKGAMDFAGIFKIIKQQIPQVKFKLLGTKGIFNTKEEVLRFFPKKLHKDIEVVPSFASSHLPNLLEDCHIGLFPSYLESFGFGALEMMAAGLPVIAYDAPGPSDFIDPHFLVPTGDYKAMAEKIVKLLNNEELLKKSSLKVKLKVFDQYCWDDIAQKVDVVYRDFLQTIRCLEISELTREQVKNYEPNIKC